MGMNIYVWEGANIYEHRNLSRSIFKENVQFFLFSLLPKFEIMRLVLNISTCTQCMRFDNLKKNSGIQPSKWIGPLYCKRNCRL